MKETDLAWLAGLLEGEGSFLKAPPSKPNCPRVSLEMTDKDVVERAALLMDGKAVRVNVRNDLWKQSYRVIIRGSRGVALMRLLYPMMSARRRAQIDAALEKYIPRKKGDNKRRLSEDQVREIRDRIGFTISALARGFGVSRASIRDVRNGKSWAYVK
jgi:DNA-binding transcriptional regulator YiaG